jgi:N-methylhydantoinase A/oxoprolinase/acetone carboxylase beta subunit
MDMDARKAWVVGTDIGGTFTDIIGVNLVTGEQRLGKVRRRRPPASTG